MAIFPLPGIRISGIASAVPRGVYHNRDYEYLTEKEKELFIKTVGVAKRRVAPKGMTTSDLCEAAAIKLMHELGWDPADIEILVFISQSRDYLIPATAGILQEKLGLPKSCVAFDISLGCSGYVYGLSVMGSQMLTAGIQKGLLMVGDVSTQTTGPRDKSTFPLFGDAGTVTALTLDPQAAPMHFNLQTDGKGYKAIIIPDGGIRNLVTPESFTEEKITEGIERNRLQIALDGMEVFRFSLREVQPNIERMLQDAGKNLEEVDYFVLHQANRLMNESIRKKMRIPPEKCPYSMEEYGNTSSASIPLTISHALRDVIQEGKNRLVLSGFGVGLSWGSVYLETEKLVCPEIIEI
ncbi:MAG: ketoacyl-ACP synthase III [Bacteroidales bacterium]|nr:ketoacyl-ACP synthase III [Bacteroidales bacterium]